MAKTFVSYARGSIDVARRLTSDIASLGHEVWFDQHLTGGQSWWDQILLRIRGCDVLVLMLDPGSAQSDACRREFGYALALGKAIVPLVVADGVSPRLLPANLAAIQSIDYRTEDRSALADLARALGAVSVARPLPDPLPDAPKAPVSYLSEFSGRIGSPSPLSFEEQSALVLDLKKSVRNAADRGEAITLRKRPGNTG